MFQFFFNKGSGRIVDNSIVDTAKAYKRYRQAAELGDAEAQYLLGDCYYYGEGVAQDYKEAIKWYRQAAEQGYAQALYDLAYCYFNGIGVPKDKAETIKWLRLAAEQGINQAHALLFLLED